MHNSIKKVLIAAGFLITGTSHAVNLEGTIFAKAGEKFGIDPLLIYSVALAESAYGNHEKTGIRPHMFAMRTSQKAYYAVDKQDAIARLAALREANGKKIDVGLMQVNLYWGEKYYNSPEELLDAETNVMTGTAMLADAMASSENFYLGIGRYHTWKDVPRAINYGERVVAIYNNLKNLKSGQ